MTQLNQDIGVFHFVGIGGIGMSGIAEILHHQGFKVQGSDMAFNPNVKRLQDMGIHVDIGHREENADNAAVVIISSAVKADNPEVALARRKHIPVIRRAEMLAEVMRLKQSIAIAGTHGKTTTTTMVATMLEAGELDPTVINGGIINQYGTNAKIGSGAWLVAEADESDGSFTRLPAAIAVVTNIDPEHMDHYETEDRLYRAFDRFVAQVPFYGFAVICIDDPKCQELIARTQDKRLVTYGFSPQADVRGMRVKQDAGSMCFEVRIDRRGQTPRHIDKLRLPTLGEHNVSNSLAAVAIAAELGMSDTQIREGLATFSGVKRRFTLTGEANGVRVIDDYGHHPREIKAVLKTARQAVGDHKVIAIMQPHRYSRLDHLFDEFSTCFNDADHVLIADVYAAGESEIEGRNKEALAQAISARGHRSARPLDDPDQLAQIVGPLVSSGDIVVCLGAGNITQWAHKLPEELAQA